MCYKILMNFIGQWKISLKKIKKNFFVGKERKRERKEKEKSLQETIISNYSKSNMQIVIKEKN